MVLVRDTLPTFVGQWQFDPSTGTVYLNTWAQMGPLKHVREGAVPYTADRFRRDGFDVRELIGGMPVDLATWLHRCGAWEQLAMP